MHVVVRVPRHVVVDDEVDVGDIEAAAGDVGGDEDAGGAGAEAREVGGALGLREERVQGGGAVVEGVEEARQERRGCGAVGEDDDGFGGVEGGEQEGVQVGFAGLERHLQVGLVEGGGDGEGGGAGGGEGAVD